MSLDTITDQNVMDQLVAISPLSSTLLQRILSRLERSCADPFSSNLAVLKMMSGQFSSVVGAGLESLPATAECTSPEEGITPRLDALRVAVSAGDATLVLQEHERFVHREMGLLLQETKLLVRFLSLLDTADGRRVLLRHQPGVDLWLAVAAQAYPGRPEVLVEVARDACITGAFTFAASYRKLLSLDAFMVPDVLRPILDDGDSTGQALCLADDLLHSDLMVVFDGESPFTVLPAFLSCDGNVQAAVALSPMAADWLLQDVRTLSTAIHRNAVQSGWVQTLQIAERPDVLEALHQMEPAGW